MKSALDKFNLRYEAIDEKIWTTKKAKGSQHYRIKRPELFGVFHRLLPERKLNRSSDRKVEK